MAAILYSALWQHTQLHRGPTPPILLAPTYVFGPGTIVATASYGTNDGIGGIRSTISFEEILAELTEHDNGNGAANIVANLVWSDPAGGEEVLRIRYLTEADLRKLLYGRQDALADFSYPSTAWILQKFIVPDAETSFHTIVSLPVSQDGTIEYRPRILANKLTYSAANPLSLSLDPDYSLEPFSINDLDLRSAVLRQSYFILESLKGNDAHALHFRFIESTGKLYLLWSERIKPITMPRPLSRAPPLAIDFDMVGLIPPHSRNEFLLKEVIESYLVPLQQPLQQQQQQQQQQRQQQLPARSKGDSVPPKKATRKEVISALYMHAKPPLKRRKAGQTSRKGLKLPAWVDNANITYSVDDDVVDREHIKAMYSVRNVGFSSRLFTNQPRWDRNQPISDDDLSLEDMSPQRPLPIVGARAEMRLKICPAPAPGPAHAPTAAPAPTPAAPIGPRPTRSTGRVAPPRGLVLPLAQPEDIIKISANIILRITNKLTRYFSESLEFADGYKDAIVAEKGANNAEEDGIHKAVVKILQSLGSDEPQRSRKNTEMGEGVGDSDGEGEDRSVGTSSHVGDLTWSQSRFKRAMELLICVPNHRPADQLCTVLLWVLSSGSLSTSPESDSRLHGDILAAKSMQAGFDKYIHSIVELLSEVSENGSRRGVATELRCWIVDKYQVLQEETETHKRSPVFGNYALPKKPLFNGPIMRLGNYTDEDVDEEDEESPGHEVKVTRKVRLHMGMQEFQCAMGWPGPKLVDDAPKSYLRVAMSDSVVPPLLASYTEVPAMLRTDRKGYLHKPLSAIGGHEEYDLDLLEQRHDAAPASVQMKEVTLASFSQFARNNALDAARSPPTHVERVLAFFRQAPTLTAGQRSLILNAFMIDICQASVLNISVLCRHTWAGKTITLDDILLIFGKPLFTIMGKRTLNALVSWFTANRKSENSFKIGNPTLTDLALQRMYAYWPQLSIELQYNNMNELQKPKTPPAALKTQESAPSSSSSSSSSFRKNKYAGVASSPPPNSRPNSRPTSKTGTRSVSRPRIDTASSSAGGGAIEVAYVWNDRYRVDRIFKEPHLFVPNVNNV